ncbi:MAG: aminopeptidase P family protein [Phycisphaeraceae bacterium]|nr:MAG: aminopeptidase P family protein [Phycisphaeraceae bacterium]
MTTTHSAVVLAGIPSINKAVYHRIRFAAHDPAIIIETPGTPGSSTTGTGGAPVRTLILRDVEVARAKAHARADRVFCYEDFTPPPGILSASGGLSGDREIRAAQSAAECLRRMDIRTITVDRSFPFLFAEMIRSANIEVVLDPELGVRERRSKDAQEVEAMQRAQSVTERAIEMALCLIARAQTRSDGVLIDPDDSSRPLTSEAVKRRIDVFLMEHGLSSDGHIVAAGAAGGDCHNPGAGPIRTGEPVIVDVFPRDNATGYHGDCTRMVVHGDIPDGIRKMHSAVVEAKRAAIAATRAGVTGEDVHRAAIEVIRKHGYALGFPPEDAPAGFCSMPHGTGHGLGLDLKEPPLLDMKGPELVAGDAVTIEPGLYMPGVGGMRLEDLVIVTEDGCENLNRLGEGLEWG